MITTRIIKNAVIIGLIAICLMLYKCPIKAIFGVDCPGCGMTRAYKELARLDFAAAFRYHQLFPMPIIVCIYQMFRKKINIGQKNETIAIAAILFIFLVRWVVILII